MTLICAHSGEHTVILFMNVFFCVLLEEWYHVQVCKRKQVRTLTVRCWKSHARMMLVATLGKMPRFFWRFLSLSGSSSSPVPGEATLLSKPSPDQNEISLETEHNLLQPHALFVM